MKRSDPHRARLDRPGGVVAIAGDRLRGTATSTPARDRGQPAPPAAAPRHRRRPPITPAPLAGRARARTAARSSAGSSASARAASRSSSPPRRTSSTTSTKSQKDVYISLEIYNNNVAANILKTQIAAGNAPDIIGPVGVEGLNLFRDQLLDLAPLIAKTELQRDQASTPSSSTSSSSARAAPRSACRSRPTRRSCTTTRTSSTRPSCRTRRPRSVTCTRASRGTWPRSASSA